MKGTSGKDHAGNFRECWARTAAAFDSLSLGFMILDQHYSIAYTNRALERLLRLESKNFTVGDIEKLLEPALRLRERYDEVMRDRTPLDVDDVVICGKYSRVLLAPAVITHGHNEIAGVVVVLENIAEHKSFEDAKTSFATITSHELRTPLSIIRGNAELLREALSKTPHEKELDTMLSSIEKSAVRLLDIVNDLLDISALESKSVQFQKERLDAVRLLEEIVAGFGAKAKEKGLLLALVEPATPIPPVIADRTHALQVLMNLVRNSLQYTERGGVTLSAVDDGAFVKILVSDTGVGIEPENQGGLFQKFSAVEDRFLHSKEYGSGMGLYIAKLLVESMGGKIKLETSRPGEGSTFSITLPRAPS